MTVFRPHGADPRHQMGEDSSTQSKGMSQVGPIFSGASSVSRNRFACGSYSKNDRTRRVAGAPSRERMHAALDAAMDRYAAGDDTAFAEVYDKLSPRLFGYLLRHTRDHARAEDIVQQTMLRVHRARGRFLPGAEVMPWAFAIARRLLIDSHRRGGREVLAQNDDDDHASLLAAVDAGADDIAIAKETAAMLDAELKRLPENQRVAFELIKQEGLSVAEAAQVLGTTVAAVKLRAHRAYEALREALAAAASTAAGAAGKEKA